MTSPFENEPVELLSARSCLMRLNQQLAGEKEHSASKEEHSAINKKEQSETIAYTAALAQLQAQLAQSIETYEQSQDEQSQNEQSQNAPTSGKQPYEEDLMGRTELLWLCNQCDYYWAKPQPLIAKGRKNRALWHIRRVLGALAYLKVLAYGRRLLGRSTAPCVSWRELLSGFKL